MSALASFGRLARSCVRQILHLYYPRIEVEGRELIPSGAVLFVANHPNSLMDPALIGFATQRPVHFFAKAPLFDVPVFGALMRALGMVPAYRGQDDKAQVRKNLETFDIGASYLKRGDAVGIFPEGKSHDREGVEQVRSGAARIAWQAVKDGAAVTIVPLGLNYERKERFRSAVWVRVGEPINASAWFQSRVGEEKSALRALTEEIDLRLKHVIVHLNEERWEPFLPELEVLLPPEGIERRDAIAALRQRKRLADAMNHFLATDRPRAEAMAAAIEQHRAQLASAGLTMESPVLRVGMARLVGRFLSDVLRSLIGLAPAIAGTLHHIVPFVLTRLVVRFVKYPGRTTIAQNRLMIGLPVYGLWYGLVWWFLALQTRVWIAWLWIGLMPLAGVTALHYASRARQACQLWRQQLKMLTRPGQLRQLRTQQARLRQELEHLRTDYYSRTSPATQPKIE